MSSPESIPPPLPSDEGFAIVQSSVRSAAGSRDLVTGVVGSKIVHGVAAAAVYAMVSLNLLSFSPPQGESAIEIQATFSDASSAATEASAKLEITQVDDPSETVAEPQPQSVSTPGEEQILASPITDLAMVAASRQVPRIENGELQPSESLQEDGELADEVESTDQMESQPTFADHASRTRNLKVEESSVAAAARPDRVPPSEKPPASVVVATLPEVLEVAESKAPASDRPAPESSEASAASLPAMSARGVESTTLPVSADCPDPLYPPDLSARRIRGEVVLKLHIDSSGAVASADVVRSSGYPQMDKSALDAVKKWKFQPARQFGMPIAIDILKRFRFEPVTEE